MKERAHLTRVQGPNHVEVQLLAVLPSLDHQLLSSQISQKSNQKPIWDAFSSYIQTHEYTTQSRQDSKGSAYKSPRVSLRASEQRTCYAVAQDTTPTKYKMYIAHSGDLCGVPGPRINPLMLDLFPRPHHLPRCPPTSTVCPSQYPLTTTSFSTSGLHSATPFCPLQASFPN